MRTLTAPAATALAAIDHDVVGVTIAFNHKLMRGCRAVKVRTMGFDAFESVNSSNRGEFFADGVRLLADRVEFARVPYDIDVTAGKIKAIPLDKMAERYKKGELDQVVR